MAMGRQNPVGVDQPHNQRRRSPGVAALGARSNSGLPAVPVSVVALQPRARSYIRLGSGICSLGLPWAVERPLKRRVIVTRLSKGVVGISGVIAVVAATAPR